MYLVELLLCKPGIRFGTCLVAKCLPAIPVDDRHDMLRQIALLDAPIAQLDWWNSLF